MLRDLMIAVAGVGGLFAVWLMVQALVRLRDPGMASDDDVLACRMCSGEGSCSCGLRSLQSKSQGPTRDGSSNGG